MRPPPPPPPRVDHRGTFCLRFLRRADFIMYLGVLNTKITKKKIYQKIFRGAGVTSKSPKFSNLHNISLASSRRDSHFETQLDLFDGQLGKK